MIRPVPALLALVAATAALPALEISDNDSKIGIGLFSQVVAAKASASTNTGDSYNATEGVNGKSDDLDFYLRRFRPYIKGAYKGIMFEATFQGDGWGRANGTGLPGTANTGTAAFGLFQGFVGKTWKGNLTHTVTAGKQLAWFNRGNSLPMTHMFAGNRASAALVAPVGVGVGYRLVAPFVNLGVDVQNNTGDDATSQQGTASTKGNQPEGMCYTTRIELTGKDADSWNIDGWKESFAGKAGKGVALGFEAGVNQRDRTNQVAANANANPPIAFQAGQVQKTDVYGVDLLLHVDGLTALAEFRHRGIYTKNLDSDKKDSEGADILVLQAGYAFPVEALGGVLEPALRFQDIDMNTGNEKEGKPFGGGDFGNSGRQIDVALNLYLAGHNNKINLMYTRWTGEEGTTPATDEKPMANIVRLQHQLNF